MESQNNITEQMKEAARNAESKAFTGMENVWDKVTARLDADEEPKPAVVPFINYKKMAAAAAVLILMGLGAGYLLFNDKAEHTIAKNDLESVNHIETPEKPVVTAVQPHVPKENIAIPRDINKTPGYTVTSNNEPRDVEDAVANINHPSVSNEGIPVAEATEVVLETQVAPIFPSNNGIAIAKGKVIDQNNEGIPGAYIKIAGTTLGTITDVDGNFEIETHGNNEKLTIGVLGFEEQTLNASRSMVVNLKPSNIASLTEVVVAQPHGPRISKQQYVGAADVISEKQINKMPLSDITKAIESNGAAHFGYGNTITNNSAAYLNNKPVAVNNMPLSDITKAIEGAAPGIQVTNGSGQPGSGATLQLRGVGSLSQSTAPLIIVDGAPYDGDISSIDPKDIESITVLKDTTIGALYGSRASNGTIVFKTKEKTKEVLDVQNKPINSAIAKNNSKAGVDSLSAVVSKTTHCMGSFPLSTKPCIVLNGAPYDGDITSIEPNTIAKITVLKDAMATSLYGARGAYGVIIITTKDYEAKSKKWSLKNLFKKHSTSSKADSTHQ